MFNMTTVTLIANRRDLYTSIYYISGGLIVNVFMAGKSSKGLASWEVMPFCHCIMKASADKTKHVKERTANIGSQTRNKAVQAISAKYGHAASCDSDAARHRQI